MWKEVGLKKVIGHAHWTAIGRLTCRRLEVRVPIEYLAVKAGAINWKYSIDI